MIDPLSRIDDEDCREGIRIFRTHLEIMLASLLDDDRDAALLQLDEAEAASLDQVRALSAELGGNGGPFSFALAILGETFQRLRLVIEAPDEERPGQPKTQ